MEFHGRLKLLPFERFLQGVGAKSAKYQEVAVSVHSLFISIKRWQYPFISLISYPFILLDFCCGIISVDTGIQTRPDKIKPADQA